jgi:hypothetical protein
MAEIAIEQSTWKWTSLIFPTLLICIGLVAIEFTVGGTANVEIRNLSNTTIGNLTLKTGIEAKTIDVLKKGETAHLQLKRTPYFDVVTASLKTEDGKQAVAIGTGNLGPFEFDIVSTNQIVWAERKEYRLP